MEYFVDKIYTKLTPDRCGRAHQVGLEHQRGASENQPAPASSSSDADDTRPGSGAILGGVLLVGAAAGYALIAFRLKNNYARRHARQGAKFQDGAF